MNRESAIKILKDMVEDYKDNNFSKDKEALEYAIKELTAQEVPVQEQLDDSITTRVGNTTVVMDKDGMTTIVR